MERLQDLSTVDAGVVGGLPPRVAGTVDKMVRVDASFYDRGTFVAAVERRSTGGQNPGSYTHLTLPTTHPVLVPVGAG